MRRTSAAWARSAAISARIRASSSCASLLAALAATPPLVLGLGALRPLPRLQLFEEADTVRAETPAQREPLGADHARKLPHPFLLRGEGLPEALAKARDVRSRLLATLAALGRFPTG